MPFSTLYAYGSYALDDTSSCQKHDMSIEDRIEVNALQRSAMYLNRFGNLTCVRGEPFTELTLSVFQS